ncbi:MAG: ribonuclease H-like domain-containing protein [Clostridia bacterium]|nr:ribonuclease H-like domain-containing protein [Clostridia bacterium]
MRNIKITKKIWYTVKTGYGTVHAMGGFMDLRSKLEMYKSSQVNKIEKPISSRLDIHEVLQVTPCENEAGKYYVIEKRYPLFHNHGGYGLGQLFDINLKSMTCIFSGLDEEIPIKELVFLDTETTGLSGGVGTVAFLIGTGFFENDCFVMRQFFMRDYDEELAVLQGLNSMLSQFKGLITFNGKAFDWNLLNTRFTYNRIRIDMKDPVHLDLLFPSRRIWKMKLESCRLTSLEENILGEYRQDDIPGALIPSIYFKYLEDRDATEIKQVIKHNELDILSMVALMIKINSMLENPLSETDGDKELLSIGRILEGNEQYEAMADCYKNCIKSENSFVKEAAARRLATVFKRNKDYESAVRQWEQMLADTETLSAYPLIELAKYYEHKAKDMGKALEMAEKAAQLISKIGLNNRMHYADIKKRCDRLKRKAGKIDA